LKSLFIENKFYLNLLDIQSPILSLCLFIFFTTNKILKFNFIKKIFEKISNFKKNQKIITFINLILNKISNNKILLLASIPLHIYSAKLSILNDILYDLNNDEKNKLLIKDDLGITVNLFCKDYILDMIKILKYDQLYNKILDSKPFYISNFYREIIDGLNEKIKILYPDYENILEQTKILEYIRFNPYKEADEKYRICEKVLPKPDIVDFNLNQTATNLDFLRVNYNNTEEEFQISENELPKIQNRKPMILYAKNKILNILRSNTILYFPFFITIVKLTKNIKILIFLIFLILNLFYPHLDVSLIQLYLLQSSLNLINPIIIDISNIDYEK
jgi:hypothetical protein